MHSLVERVYSGVLIFIYAVPYGNHGCKGGNMYDSYNYIINNEGIDTAKSYGYVAQVSIKQVESQNNMLRF